MGALIQATSGAALLEIASNEGASMSACEVNGNGHVPYLKENSGQQTLLQICICFYVFHIV